MGNFFEFFASSRSDITSADVIASKRSTHKTRFLTFFNFISYVTTAANVSAIESFGNTRLGRLFRWFLSIPFIERWILEGIVLRADEVATAATNGEVAVELIHGSYPDKRDLPDINDSPTPYLKEGLIGLALLIIFVKAIKNFIDKQKEKEVASDAEHFIKISNSKEFQDWLLDHAQIKTPIKILRAINFYHNPSLSSLLLWFRQTKDRIKSWFTENEYSVLQTYLKKNAFKKSKKQLLNELQEQSYKLLFDYLKYTGMGDWEVKISVNGKWIIKNKNFKKDKQTNSNEAKKSIFKITIEFIDDRIEEISTISYVFWILIFISYLFVSFTPWVMPIAASLLGAWWGIKFGKYIYNKFCPQEKNGVDTDQRLWTAVKRVSKKLDLHKDSKLIERLKQQVKILENKLTVKKEKAIEDKTFFCDDKAIILGIDIELKLLGNELLQVKNKLAKKLVEKAAKDAKEKFLRDEVKRSISEKVRKTVRNSRDVVFLRTFFVGFMNGFFSISFSSWFLTAFLAWLAKLIVGVVIFTSPLALAIIAGITLALGIAYGIYKAIKFYKAHIKSLEIREEKCKLYGLCSVQPKNKKQEQRELVNQKFFEAYLDHTLFDKKEDKTGWFKKRGKKFWKFIKESASVTYDALNNSGTGILYLKLVGSAFVSIASVVLACTAGTAALWPLAGFFIAGALIFIFWNWYKKDLEKDENKLDQLIAEIEDEKLISDTKKELQQNNGFIPNQKNKNDLSFEPTRTPTSIVSVRDDEISKTMPVKSAEHTQLFMKVRPNGGNWTHTTNLKGSGDAAANEALDEGNKDSKSIFCCII